MIYENMEFIFGMKQLSFIRMPKLRSNMMQMFFKWSEIKMKF